MRGPRSKFLQFLGGGKENNLFFQGRGGEFLRWFNGGKNLHVSLGSETFHTAMPLSGERCVLFHWERGGGDIFGLRRGEAFWLGVPKDSKTQINSVEK